MIEKKTRTSNFELLRIVAMFFIILSHFSVHGGFDYSTSTLSINRLFIQFIVLGNVGVNIFVLISGWFLIDSNKVNIKKVVRMWLQLLFYSIVIFFFFVVAKIDRENTVISFSEVCHYCFPVSNSLWWFASTYFLLYLLHPFINKFFYSLDKKALLSLVLLATVLWVLIPSFSGKMMGSNELIWFIYLYFIAGVLKKHSDSLRIPCTKKLIWICLIAFALLFCSSLLIDLLGIKSPKIGQFYSFFYLQRSILVLVISILLFVLFSRLEMRSSLVVNSISSTTFGVYLIHEHEIMRPFIWKSIFMNSSYSESPFLIPYCFLVVLIVFLSSALLEKMRQLLERALSKVIELISNIVQKIVDIVVCSISRVL